MAKLRGSSPTAKRIWLPRHFSVEVSGAKAYRSQLTKLLASLGAVLDFSRNALGPSRQIYSVPTLHRVIYSIFFIDFLSLADPWAYTSTAIGKLMLTMLSCVAEFERDLISLRTSDSLQRAMKSGVKFGPKFKLIEHQMDEIRRRKEQGKSCRFLSRSYGVSANTISLIKAV